MFQLRPAGGSGADKARDKPGAISYGRLSDVLCLPGNDDWVVIHGRGPFVLEMRGGDGDFTLREDVGGADV